MSVLKLLNGNSRATNTLKLHAINAGCCGQNSMICKMEAATNADPKEGITIEEDGVQTVYMFDAPAITPKEVRVAIAKALREAGYDPYYADSYKSINVATTGEIAIIGDVNVVSVTVNGAEVPFTKKCDMVKICKVKGYVDYDTDLVITKNGVDETVGNYSAGTDVATIAADVAAAAELAADVVLVEVVEDVSNGAFVVTIHSKDCSDTILNGDIMSACGAYQEFA